MHGECVKTVMDEVGMLSIKICKVESKLLELLELYGHVTLPNSVLIFIELSTRE